MTYHFVHYFEPGYYHIPEEKKLEIAMERAVEDLAKELMKYAHFEVDQEGNVRGELKLD